MTMIAGVDIGNSTTEVCVGRVNTESKIEFLSSSSYPTTGMKGTVANVNGIIMALKQAMTEMGKSIQDISLIRINEATPVIGDTAMETLTETIITDSTMIGHNPSTPAGIGYAVGELIRIEQLGKSVSGKQYIVVASKEYSYDQVATMINSVSEFLNICGIILQADEAVLVYNRLKKKIPIIDEVSLIDKIPERNIAAIEVAMQGQGIRMLSNPYGIATLLKLNADETKNITPISKSLIGKRSAVVIKTPIGGMRANTLPAGSIFLCADHQRTVSLDEGAAKIMETVEQAGEIYNITGETDTNVGKMFQRIRQEMESIHGEREEEVSIKDILAVDTIAPIKIKGALAGEVCMEKAIGIAAMVKTNQLPMKKIAEKLQKELGVPVLVAGVEAIMASLGAVTTPGVKLPLAVLDMGGGSTDAAIIQEDGRIQMIHQAGAGELVSMLIQAELGIKDRHTAELIKRYPLAKIESLFHMRTENDQMIFAEKSIDPKLLGRVVLITENGLSRLEDEIPMEKIVQVRREAKRKVFVTNALRALKRVAPQNNLKKIPNVVLVGGSSEDFEIPEMLMEEFANYKIVCGRGNIRGVEGARNAVATGLVLSYLGDM